MKVKKINTSKNKENEYLFHRWFCYALPKGTIKLMEKDTLYSGPFYLTDTIPSDLVNMTYINYLLIENNEFKGLSIYSKGDIIEVYKGENLGIKFSSFREYIKYVRKNYEL